MSNESKGGHALRGPFSTWAALRDFISRTLGGYSERAQAFGGTRGAAIAVRWSVFVNALSLRRAALREAMFWLLLTLVGFALVRQGSSVAVEKNLGWEFYSLEVKPGIVLSRGDLLTVEIEDGTLEDVPVLDPGRDDRPLVALRRDEVRLVEIARQRGRIKISRKPESIFRSRPVKAAASLPIQIWEGK